MDSYCPKNKKENPMIHEWQKIFENGVNPIEEFAPLLWVEKGETL